MMFVSQKLPDFTDASKDSNFIISWYGTRLINCGSKSYFILQFIDYGYTSKKILHHLRQRQHRGSTHMCCRLP